MKLSLKFRQISIFTLGWIAYGSTYFLRKPLGVVQKLLFFFKFIVNIFGQITDTHNNVVYVMA